MAGGTTFTVTSETSAYGVPAGGTVQLDAADPLVQLNVQAGTITAGKQDEKAEPAVMTCPLCVEQGQKRPAKLASADEVEEHYAEKHPGFQPPEWRTD